MLTVTETAGAHLSQMLGQVNASEDMAVRVVVEEDGLALKLDSESDGDATFEHEGKTVLVLDGPVSELLDDKTLDVADDGEGPKLSLS